MKCSAFLERIPDNLLLNPIDYIFADHCRQSFMCKALQMVSHENETTPPFVEMVGAVLHYLNHDLPLHIEDEESDLFPQLQNRSVPGDDFVSIQDRITNDHEIDERMSQQLRSELTRIADGHAPVDLEAFKATSKTFSTALLKHLSWENAALLPLARERLHASDLIAIGRTMAKRRALPYPGNE